MTLTLVFVVKVRYTQQVQRNYWRVSLFFCHGRVQERLVPQMDMYHLCRWTVLRTDVNNDMYSLFVFLFFFHKLKRANESSHLCTFPEDRSSNYSTHLLHSAPPPIHIHNAISLKVIELFFFTAFANLHTGV